MVTLNIIFQRRTRERRMGDRHGRRDAGRLPRISQDVQSDQTITTYSVRLLLLTEQIMSHQRRHEMSKINKKNYKKP